MTTQRIQALILAFIVIAVAGAVYWIIGALVGDAQRNDQLQQQCIARGGNWDYGCEMRPK